MPSLEVLSFFWHLLNTIERSAQTSHLHAKPSRSFLSPTCKGVCSCPKERPMLLTLQTATVVFQASLNAIKPSAHISGRLLSACQAQMQSPADMPRRQHCVSVSALPQSNQCCRQARKCSSCSRICSTMSSLLRTDKSPAHNSHLHAKPNFKLNAAAVNFCLPLLNKCKQLHRVAPDARSKLENAFRIPISVQQIDASAQDLLFICQAQSPT